MLHLRAVAGDLVGADPLHCVTVWLCDCAAPAGVHHAAPGRGGGHPDWRELRGPLVQHDPQHDDPAHVRHHNLRAGQRQGEFRADGCEFRADGCEFRADGCESRADGCEFRADGCESRADGCESRADGCESQADGCESRAD
eukprot:8114963-Pyramimonas_sp.AAC.2